jgi:hypothetical protein
MFLILQYFSLNYSVHRKFIFYCLGVIFTTAPQKTDDSRIFFTKYGGQPEKLPIRHFTNLKSVDLQKVGFYDAHGPELELFCHNVVAFRRSIFNILIS